MGAQQRWAMVNVVGALVALSSTWVAAQDAPAVEALLLVSLARVGSWRPARVFSVAPTLDAACQWCQRPVRAPHLYTPCRTPRRS